MRQKAANPKLPPVPKARMAFLAGGGLALLAGLDAALLRLGLAAPVESASLSSLHGILMLYGFLGTAITLERAVALRSDKASVTWWGFVAPAASGLGVIAALIGTAMSGSPFTRIIPAALWVLSMLALVVIYLVIWTRQQTFFLLIQILGAVAGLIGITLWGRGLDVPLVVPWWTAFLVLTIIGERLELARIAFLDPRLETRITAEVLAFVFALPLTLLAPVAGYILLGAALIVLVLDVATHDVARRLVHTQGLPRFSAAAMLSGYAWALVAGGIWLVGGAALSGYRYDTVVHALTIGFALSMVLAHAPIILPALARRPLPYSPALWVAWGTLQVGLAIRVISGARDWQDGWQTGGVTNVLAVLGFALSVIALLTFKKTPQPTGGERP